MIAIYRNNSCFEFALPSSYIEFTGLDYRNYLEKDNLPFIRDERGFVLLASNTSLGFEVLREHMSELKPLNNLDDLFDNVDKIKTILDDFCMIDNDGKFCDTLVIANNERAYKIDSKFTVTEINDVTFIGSRYEDYDYFNRFLNFEKGTTKEKVINTINKLSQADLGILPHIVIMNSKNDNIEII